MELAIEELAYLHKKLKDLRRLCRLWFHTMKSEIPTEVYTEIDDHVKRVEKVSEQVREELGIDSQKWLELQTFMTLLRGF